MTKILLVLMLLSALAEKAYCCPGNWNAYQDYCYGLISTTLDWYTARDECRKNHDSELVSISRLDENDYVQDLIQSTSGIWTGLSMINLDTFAWIDGSPITYDNWSDGEPNNSDGEELCVAMRMYDGYWNDDNCARGYASVCKYYEGTITSPATLPPHIEGTCPYGFVSEDFSNKCFLVGNNRLDWDAALEACEDMGGTLASITSAAEQSFVLLLVEDYDVDLWIGLRDGDDMYAWSDNSKIEYTNYGPFSDLTSGYNCFAMDLTGKDLGQWIKKSCDRTSIYICQATREANTVTDPPTFEDQYSDPTCAEDYFLYHGRCYKFYGDAQSWDDASATCSADGAQLALPVDLFEMARLTYASLEDGVLKQSWIGAYYKQETGMYLWGNNYPVETTFWDVTEPSEGFDAACVSIMEDVWFDEDCSYAYPFFCMTGDLTGLIPTPDPSGKYCPNQNHTDFEDYCYSTSLTGVLINWYDANEACQESGMELVSIHSPEENTFVNDLTSAVRGPESTWIGLEYGAGAGTAAYRWTDGSSNNYDNWKDGGAGNADGGCVVMEAESTWTAIECTELMGYTCKTPKVWIPSPTTTATTTVVRIETTEETTDRGAVRIETTETAEPLDKPDNSETGSNSAGLSGGAILGIVVTVLIVVVVVAAAGYLTITKRWPLVTDRLPFRKSGDTEKLKFIYRNGEDGLDKI